MSELFCAWAELATIAPVITALPWPDPTFMWLERLPDAWLSPEERQNGARLDYYDARTPFDNWGRGRVFSTTGELRWEYIDGRFHAVYCGEERPAHFIPEPLAVADGAGAEARYYLWGRRVSDADLQDLKPRAGSITYIETRIPRVLFYPDLQSNPALDRIRVKVREWYALDGSLVYARWCGLEAAR